MPKLSKPDRLDLIWASEALPANISTPDADGKVTGTSGTYFVTTGWEQVKPPYELENWIQNQQSQFSAYINQLGIPEWDSSTEYQANKSYVQGSNNILYKCISTHSGRNPAAGNPSYWEVFEGNRQATTSARGTVELATDAEAVAGTSDTLAVTPSGLQAGIDASVKVASESQQGIIEIATQSETNSGSDDTRAVTPKKLRFGFSSSLGSTGYISLPSWLGGITLQWGETTVGGDSSKNITFAKAFPSACYQAISSLGSSFDTQGDAGCSVYNISRTGATVRNGVNGTVTVRYFAIGS